MGLLGTLTLRCGTFCFADIQTSQVTQQEKFTKWQPVCFIAGSQHRPRVGERHWGLKCEDSVRLLAGTYPGVLSRNRSWKSQPRVLRCVDKGWGGLARRPRNNHRCYPVMLWTPAANTAHRGASSLDKDPLVLLGFDNGLINTLNEP